jgi:predicted  nucleic acid-binding Zn-ribbon protein
MADAESVLLEMLKGLRHDVAVIRDNHLAHIAQDIEDIKKEQTEARRDIDDLMDFKAELQAQIGSAINRILLIALTSITASIGVPMAL